mmetsp:Transcript_9624/g.19192  ORF Transcript_9624/g.19192 Transcript_9624/m.19192 type:complete len:214 (-) Transcript_9624:731-1372(-)
MTKNSDLIFLRLFPTSTASQLFLLLSLLALRVTFWGMGSGIVGPMSSLLAFFAAPTPLLPFFWGSVTVKSCPIMSWLTLAGVGAERRSLTLLSTVSISFLWIIFSWLLIWAAAMAASLSLGCTDPRTGDTALLPGWLFEPESFAFFFLVGTSTFMVLRLRLTSEKSMTTSPSPFALLPPTSSDCHFSHILLSSRLYVFCSFSAAMCTGCPTGL